jgi:DNA sulfur modification protein DndD
MILKRMTLNNFRQFYGYQPQLEFISPDHRKNVTVIYGENGKGKTSLYRALMFCLYGIKKLSQDPQESDREINLVNKVALDEAAERGEDVKAFVEIEFMHDRKNYVLKREILGIKSENEEVEQIGDMSLAETREDGNTVLLKDPDDIAVKINSILDIRVREYFLFDGEKIEKLTRVDRENRKEIETGIKNLLQIDRLSIAIQGIDKLLKDIGEKLKNKSTGEYQRKLIELEEKENEREDLVRDIEKSYTEIAAAENEQKKLDRKLKEFEGIKDLLQKREETQNSLDMTQDSLKKLLDEMKKKNKNIALLLIESEMEEVDKLIGIKRKNKEIPPQIREDLVNKILQDMKCAVCNRPIEEHSDSYKHVLEWKKKMIGEDVENELIETWRKIEGLKEFTVHTANWVQQALLNHSNKIDGIGKYEQILKDISDEIGDRKIDEKIPELEKVRKETIKKIGHLENRIETKSKELNILDDEIRTLKRILEDLERKESIKDTLTKRRQLVSDAKDALETIYNEFTDEIKEKIGEKATEIFHNLIDKADRHTFQKIKVMQDYSLQLIDWRDNAFLSNISAGQRQITSIAFIAALARLAGKKDILEIPLFMDTPFGRLSGVHRDNLIEYIPKLTRQWILLATDTEFSREEADKLRNTGRWGKVYTLESQKPFVTVIEEKKVETFKPVRSGILRSFQ